MELVYLWVEDYKNIKKQGFNFSPRFNCDYDDKTKELTIKENDDYIENFFGDNINVTAIVGKNGSGKTGLLKYFLKLDAYLAHEDEFYNEDSEKVKNFICVFFDKKLYYMSNIKDIESNLVQDESIPFIRTSYYLNTLDDYNSSLMDLRFGDIRLEKDRIIAILSALYKSKYGFEFYPSHSLINNSDYRLSTFLYMPIKIEIIPIELKKVYEWRMDMFFGNASDEDRKKIVKYKKEIFDILEDDYYKFLVMSYLEKVDKLYNLEVLNNKDKLILEYNKLTFEKFEKITESDYYKYFSKREINLKDIDDFERFIYFGKNYNDFFDYDLIDQQNRKYNHLSSGEQTIFGLLLNMYFQLNLKYNYQEEDEAYIFCLDEPDISLHPNWQKKYISEVLSLCKKFNKKIHLLITTHSPFLLSDIPKQNIIFLDTYENGNCKVVDGLKDKKQTFGANIHTLLSDSFFMEDGLMGEFAKGKIDEVISYLNGKKDTKIKNDDEAQKLVNIIGEPIVKNQLQRMLDSKRLKKVDEIDTIKQNMIAMQKRLDELEK
jgi:predicted ATPase